MESFYTVQGEGFHSGKAAYFIRTAGCDVGCVWCDVKESWPSEGYPSVSAHEIASRTEEHPAETVVITGGEPCMYDLTELCNALHERGKKVHLETSAAYEIKGDFDWICVSPKKFKAPLQGELKKAHELKVIGFNKSDLDFALSFESEVSSDCKLYIQPEWSRRDRMAQPISEFVKSHPRWMVSVQSHKYLNIP